MRVARVRGFTLVEMLVVLVLVSLVSTLAYEAVGYFANIHGRVAGRIEQQEKDAHAIRWLRTSLVGIIPDYDQPSGAILGDSLSISANSLAGLDGTPGISALVNWEIQASGNGGVLVYSGETARDWEILRWLGAADGFSFMDGSGTWHPEWPPRSAKAPSLPSLIRFSYPGRVIVSSIHADWSPPPYTGD